MGNSVSLYWVVIYNMPCRFFIVFNTTTSVFQTRHLVRETTRWTQASRLIGIRLVKRTES